jgi:hypothetical protein
MLRLYIETYNDAFTEDRNAEIARILRLIADKIESGSNAGKAFDVNGNNVGGYQILSAD